ncbi:hypothetical protein [Mesorhizobium sp.]|uniref:hypothetical protein n=1 Tax=Mesorhizobium sp. TaxID=1871066 RepID=UPI000FE7DA5F|nr:hypothetical protein [Mesorhizobium sp.]RWF66848.1 MAG: hypothetical protein EOS47_04480 [Mesorhizobium sp.]
MKSFLTITTPANDLTLLTIEAMREAAGITGGGSDTSLRAMEARCAASIMSECGIAVGSGGAPTLRRETLTETFYQACGEQLILSRRHEISITSIVEDSVTLIDTDFIVDPESGLLNKLCSDCPSWWSARKVVVVYGAGFTTVPADLEEAAFDFFRSSWLEKSRDPLVKSERVKVENVDETERQFWVGSVPGQSSEGAVPDVVAGQLKRFRNIGLG